MRILFWNVFPRDDCPNVALTWRTLLAAFREHSPDLLILANVSRDLLQFIRREPTELMSYHCYDVFPRIPSLSNGTAIFTKSRLTLIHKQQSTLQNTKQGRRSIQCTVQTDNAMPSADNCFTFQVVEFDGAAAPIRLREAQFQEVLSKAMCDPYDHIVFGTGFPGWSALLEDGMETSTPETGVLNFMDASLMLPDTVSETERAESLLWTQASGPYTPAIRSDRIWIRPGPESVASYRPTRLQRVGTGDDHSPMPFAHCGLLMHLERTSS